MTTYKILRRSIDVPVQVADAASGCVLFEVDRAVAQTLAPSGFDVVETAPGRARFALTLVDCRVSDLGPAFEMGAALFVRPIAGGEVGNFFIHQPVTDELASAAGKGIWGFPKSVQQIDVTHSQTTSRWVLSMDSKLVIDLTIPRGGSEELPVVSRTSYTFLNGKPHATEFTQGGSGFSMGSGEGVSLTLGNHPFAKELEGLGLPAAPVVLTTWIEHLTATFGEPRPI